MLTILKILEKKIVQKFEYYTRWCVCVHEQYYIFTIILIFAEIITELFIDFIATRIITDKFEGNLTSRW